MSNFYFSDKIYSCGDVIREVRLKVDNILTVLSLNKEDDYWCAHFYNTSKNEPNQYLCSINIPSNLALKIIKEAKEYQEYLYNNS